MYPSVDPAAIRPSRMGYVLAAAIGVVAAAAGVALLVWGISTGTGSRDRTFAPGESVTVRLASNGAIYVPVERVDHFDVGRCAVTSAAGRPVSVTDPDYSFTSRSGDQSWALTGIVHTPSPGDYTVRCTGGTGRFAVGEAPKMGRFVGGLIGFFVLLGVALVGAVLTSVITAVRRNRSRNRLRAQPFGVPL